MPLARRCTFQLRTLSLFWEVRGGAGGTTTARSGYPPPPDQVHSGPRLAETDAAAISCGRPDHPGGPASLAPRRVPTSMPRRLAVAPPFGRAARRRRCGAARCRSEPVLAPCLALRRVHCPAPAPQRRAAFRPRRVQAPVWRSEVPERARARSLPCAAPRSLPRTRASTPRRLSAAPRAGAGVAQRGACASSCSLGAISCAPSSLELPRAVLSRR